MVTDNYNNLASDLEKQELESLKGIISTQVYSQLLAIYLYQNDLCNAKCLWKRIPKNMSNEAINPELQAIWAVGQKMWKRDLPGTYIALAAYIWTEPVVSIMTSLEEKIRERAVTLIAKAYSSLTVDTMMFMTGLSSERVLQVCHNHGWTIQADNMIIPTKPVPPVTTQTSSEDQLYKLTEFVTFLEM